MAPTIARRLLTVGVTWLAVGQAANHEAGFVLDWCAPAACPSGAEVQAAVMELVGTELPSELKLRVRATAKQLEGGDWSVVLETSLNGISGERTLSGGSCHAVADAAVLTLALTLNPELELPNTRTEEPSHELRVTPAPPQPPLRHAPSPPPGPETIGHVRASVGLRAATLPVVAPELGVGVGVSRGRIRGFVQGLYAPPQRAHSDTRPGAGGKLWMGSVAALGCWSAVDGIVDVAPCAGADVSLIEGRGYGVDVPRRGAIFWVSPALGASIGWAIHRRLTLRLDGLTLVPSHRPALRLDGAELHRPASVAARADFGFELRVW